mgnify:CR=1 FL=1|tara:strand:+ start:1061 stop:1378 length:318 start_codon:yes stop_codon:yes gene_type:complete
MYENFLELADKSLNEISNYLEQFNESLEIDFIDNNISIETEDGKTFVISIHEPLKQIWYSSPISGAHHFEIEKENDIFSWVSTRDKALFLFELLKREIQITLKND